MTEGMTFMAQETWETPEAVQRLLDCESGLIDSLGAEIRARNPTMIVTCARGSSDNAATFFKYVTEITLGIPVVSIGPSVASLYEAPLKLRDAVVVSVSQSGQSPDIVALQGAARRAGAFSIAVVNQAGSPLAATADAVVPLHAGPERSVAATKSCVAAMVALSALVAACGRDAALGRAVQTLPDSLRATLAFEWGRALDSLTGSRSAYVIGRGPALPVAAEAALKMKETAGMHAEAFSGAEVMHGPLQLLRPGFPVIAFTQPDKSLSAMQESIARLRGFQGQVFEVSAQTGDAADRLPVARSSHSALDPIVMLLSFYAFAEKLARARGCDPDRPSLLSKVTETI